MGRINVGHARGQPDLLLLQTHPCRRKRGARLVNLRLQFVVFDGEQQLAARHARAFLHAHPGDAARNFGAQIHRLARLERAGDGQSVGHVADPDRHDVDELNLSGGNSGGIGFLGGESRGLIAAIPEQSAAQKQRDAANRQPLDERTFLLRRGRLGVKRRRLGFNGFDCNNRWHFESF